MAQDHAALLLDPLRGGGRLRGDRRQVHRRRDHGRLRGAGRPRGPRPAGLLRGTADARGRRRVRGRAAPRAGAQLLDPDRDQLRRGGRGGDRGRRRERVHGDRPHGRPGAADGGAGRARQGVPHRAHGRVGRRLPRPRRPRALRDQGRPPAGSRLRAGRGRADALAPRPLPRARLQRLRRPRRGDGEAGGGAGPGAGRRGNDDRDRRRTGDRQEPALPRVRPALPRRGAGGLRGAGAGARDRRPLHAGAADAARLLRDRRARARAAAPGRQGR